MANNNNNKKTTKTKLEQRETSKKAKTFRLENVIRQLNFLIFRLAYSGAIHWLVHVHVHFVHSLLFHRADSGWKS